MVRRMFANGFLMPLTLREPCEIASGYIVLASGPQGLPKRSREGCQIPTDRRDDRLLRPRCGNADGQRRSFLQKATTITIAWI